MPCAFRHFCRHLRVAATILIFLAISFPAMAEMSDLPGAFDLRDVDGHAYIGPVKNQGPLGVCFAFATTAVAESTYNRAMGLYDGEAERFSESFIVWSLGPSYDTFGPDGAYAVFDDLEALVAHGICSEDDFPYTLEDPGAYHWDAPRVRFASWHRLPLNDIETMKRTMLQMGGIYAVVAVDAAFYAYEDGVYANSVIATDSLEGAVSSTNHAISLVGWDDSAGENGAWILRNSWSERWALDGYMLIDYFSAGVSLKTAYLVYGDWQGEDFSLLNSEDLAVLNTESAFLPAAHGMYEWGGNYASMANSGSIHATADVESGNPYVQAMFLWAGERAAVTNTGGILAEAFTDEGMATAYGICMQGGSVLNTGDILSVAGSGSGRATAYGAKQFGFDLSADFLNGGSIEARAETDDGWAIGVEGNILGSLVNAGTVLAEGEAMSAGLVAEKVSAVLNSGLISASTVDGQAFGAVVVISGLTNSGEMHATASGSATGMLVEDWSSAWNAGIITASALGGDGTGVDVRSSSFENTGTVEVESDFTAHGLNAVRADCMNNGTISSFSASGTAVGAYLDNSALTNFGVVSGTSTTGEAYGAVLLDGSVLTNQGQIIGDTLLDGEGVLNGNGTYAGDVLNSFGLVSPGNSIGVITISGDYVQGDDAALAIELEGEGSDVLRVGGAAYLSGELQISLLDYVDSSEYLILEASSVTGTFSQVSAPAVLAVSVETGLSGLSLDVTRNTYASLGANSDQAAVGGALDSFRSAAQGDMADVLLGVDNMDLAGVRHALADMAPGIHAANRLAMVQQSCGGNAEVLDRLARRVFLQADGVPADESPAERKLPYSVWAEVSGSEGRNDGHLETPGVRLGGRSMRLGVETSPGAWTYGFAASLVRQFLDGEDDDSGADSTGVSGHLYASWDENPGRPGLYALGTFGAGRVRTSASRDMSFLGREAQSQHWAGDISAGAGVGCTLAAGAWRLQPELRLTGLYMHEDGVGEHGAGAMDLDVESADLLSWQSRLGFMVGREFRFGGVVFLPRFSAAWTHEFGPGVEDVQARFQDDGPSFTISGVDPASDSFALGTELSVVAGWVQGGLSLGWEKSDDGDCGSRRFALNVGGTF